MYDEVVDLLRETNPKRERDVRHRVLKTMLDVFPEESDLENIKLKKWSRIHAALEDLLDASDPKQLEDARDFERRFSKGGCEMPVNRDEADKLRFRFKLRMRTARTPTMGELRCNLG